MKAAVDSAIPRDRHIRVEPVEVRVEAVAVAAGGAAKDAVAMVAEPRHLAHPSGARTTLRYVPADAAGGVVTRRAVRQRVFAPRRSLVGTRCR